MLQEKRILTVDSKRNSFVHLQIIFLVRNNIVFETRLEAYGKIIGVAQS